MSLAAALSVFRNLKISNVHSKISTIQSQPRRWRMKEHDRRYLIATSPKQDSGTAGENVAPIDILSKRSEDQFPDASTPNKIFNGITFCETPVCHIRTSKNNTILNICDYLGQSIAYHSCGLEGFKNARKGTNVAAQATAVALANKAKEKGIHSIRVKIEGLGPGRMSSVKGLQMAGLKIISVTDSTHISWHPPRPRKQRRL